MAVTGVYAETTRSPRDGDDMSARLTGSGIGRAAVCPPAYSQPAVYSPQSKEAAEGHGTHEFLRAIARGDDRDHALAAVTGDARKTCEGIDVSKIPLGYPEMPLAYDVVTGRAREIEVKSHRDYSEATDTEIPGTCDLYVPATDASPARVIDWKTIRWDEPDPGLYRPQLEFYALCLARTFGLSEIVCEVKTISEDGAVGTAAEWTLDTLDLVAVARRVRYTWDQVQRALKREGIPDVTEGAHCRYCPAWVSCPAKRASVGALLEMDLGMTTEINVADAYLRAKDAEDIVEKAKVLTKEMVRMRGPIKASDGRVVRLTSNNALRVQRGG